MTQRVFVQVVGFNDTERHALNTVFRLSEQRETIYSLWTDAAGEPPKLALMDGESNESHIELEFAKVPGMKLIWVGESPPEGAWRTFQRPISWPRIVAAMDQLWAPAEAPAEDLDFDLAFEDDGPDTVPPDEPRAETKRALIAAGSREDRLYMRARLSLADLTQADDAETAAQALELARSNPYVVAMVDFGLPDVVEGWSFLKELSEVQPSLKHVIVTKDQATVSERLRAWAGGVEGFFQKPPDPERLSDLLRKV